MSHAEGVRPGTVPSRPLGHTTGKSRMTLRSLLAVLTLCTLAGVAQEAVPEPEFADVFCRLDAGKLAALERQTAAIQGKASGFIIMSTKVSSEFPGTQSPVRFHSNQFLDFVVRSPLASSTVDPNTLYVPSKLPSKKKSRELVIMAGKFTPIDGSAKTDLAQGVLPVTFVRYGASSIKMTTGPLPPGEYKEAPLGVVRYPPKKDAKIGVREELLRPAASIASLGKKKWCVPELNAEYIERMEEHP